TGSRLRLSVRRQISTRRRAKAERNFSGTVVRVWHARFDPRCHRRYLKKTGASPRSLNDVRKRLVPVRAHAYGRGMDEILGLDRRALERARISLDRCFAGKFFIAVTSTRIY